MALADLVSKLAAQSYFAEGEPCSESDMIRGDSLEAWAVELQFGQDTPTIYTLTNTAAVAEDDEVAVIATATGVTGTIRKGDAIWFDTSDKLLVCAQDTALTDAGVSVPIFPAEGAVAASETCLSYLMKRIDSFEEGFIPNSTGSEASARNRGKSLFNAKMIVSRDFSINASGTTIRNDAGLVVLERAKRGSQRIWFNSRFRPFDNYGAGIGAAYGRCFVNSSSPTASAQDFHKVSYDLMGDGTDFDYLPLGMSVAKAKTLMPDNEFVQTMSA